MFRFIIWIDIRNILLKMVSTATRFRVEWLRKQLPVDVKMEGYTNIKLGYISDDLRQIRFINNGNVLELDTIPLKILESATGFVRKTLNSKNAEWVNFIRIIPSHYWGDGFPDTSPRSENISPDSDSDFSDSDPSDSYIQVESCLNCGDCTIDKVFCCCKTYLDLCNSCNSVCGNCATFRHCTTCKKKYTFGSKICDDCHYERSFKQICPKPLSMIFGRELDGKQPRTYNKQLITNEYKQSMKVQSNQWLKVITHTCIFTEIYYRFGVASVKRIMSMKSHMSITITKSIENYPLL